MQYVYLINCGEYSKIGIANDVESRLAQLQTGNPYPLTVLFCFGFSNAEVVEKAIHQKFFVKRKSGEWFLLTQADVDDFKTICYMLGGSTEIVDANVTDSELEEAEEIGEITLGADFLPDEEKYRVERRYDSEGGLRGYAWRERSASRRAVAYLGKENKDFMKLVQKYGDEDKL